MNTAIETRSLSVTFATGAGVVTALHDLNIKIPKGTVFGFLGPNGSGKSTTMHVLLGFIEATSGEAMIFGKDVRETIARQSIGYLPERPDTYPFLTGRELLHVSGKLFNLKKRIIRERTNDLLEKVGLTAAADRRTATYSRGMLQRLCLAQALINDPELVILDEPTGGLDPFGRMDIRNIIRDLRDAGKTVFFSSHELSEVELICDHIAIVADGHVIAAGPADKLVPKGENLERYFMRVVGKHSGAPTAKTESVHETKEQESRIE